MSAAFARAAQSEEASPLGASFLLPALAAAALFPFDQVLAGMLAAGQGIQALCAFLGLTRDGLFDHLVRLGLPTPHERPLRKPAARGWSVLDTMRLIAWRVAGVHPEVIGLRLGRSATAVRAKARRIGLQAPPRRALHKPDPATLLDPEPGFGWTSPRPSPAGDAVASCGRAAGAASVPGAAGDAGAVIRLRPFSGDAAGLRPAAAAADARAVRAGGPVAGQRALPLFGVVAPGKAAEATAPVSAPSSTPTQAGQPAARGRRGRERGQTAELPLSVPEQVLRSPDDLTWLGRVRGLANDRDAVMLASLRYFGRQSYKFAAAQLGMTVAALRSLYDRIDLPRDYDRKKFGSAYDDALARANLARCDYELVQCNVTKRFWWRHKRNERFLRYSFEGARLLGQPRERVLGGRLVCL